MNATTTQADLKAQLLNAQAAFWTAESKVRNARTEASRATWVEKREALRPEYQRLLAEYAASANERSY